MDTCLSEVGHELIFKKSSDTSTATLIVFQNIEDDVVHRFSSGVPHFLGDNISHAKLK
ncbi:hypothetical protein MTR_1g084070 [Medicago truncatula]|uniref:Uncharacterized protein n=1 Tax=Medicago truncatula TaxID=3880 RepID=A0A072VM61_MEDTR|nr:hypothetical protein MTR_1g084070 [Medicago truncatula]